MKHKKTMIASFVLSTLFGAMIVKKENNTFGTTLINYENNVIPQAFDGFRICHLSDIHNKKLNETFFSKVTSLSADAIFLTGDLIDRHRMDLPEGMKTIQRLCKISQVYFIPGNHEVKLGITPSLEKLLESFGVICLRDTKINLFRGEAKINLMGLDDYPTHSRWDGINEKVMGRNCQTLEKFDLKEEECNILLSHHPEMFSLYSRFPLCLCFCGHAHGGQIRLPGVGPLFSPNQGIFPRFTSGEYKENCTSMVVSRGIGNSVFPIRINNRPEIVLVTLKRKVPKEAFIVD